MLIAILQKEKKKGTKTLTNRRQFHIEQNGWTLQSTQIKVTVNFLQFHIDIFYMHCIGKIKNTVNIQLLNSDYATM
jgi:hypothetical protein